MDLRDLFLHPLRGAALTKAQYLLMKLAEECAEVAQRCSKQMQFGPDEVQKNQIATNSERLLSELLDLFAICKLLQGIDEIPAITADKLTWAFAAKKIKMQKYLDLSAGLGMMPEILL